MRTAITVFICLLSCAANARQAAEGIFQHFAPALFQIKIIDKASGEKSSYGSGFQISSDGLVATNYHVISSFAQHPDKYTIEYLDHAGQKGTLSLLRVDIVNDLALLRGQLENTETYFELVQKTPKKGEDIFSLGNPHDLGMIVVPGTYNGLKKEAFNDRIHFTGAINSGMSGGPVVNKASQVVGVNVASSGNQIGFLIPHDKLVALREKLDTDVDNISVQTIEEQITEQLHANQKRMMAAILNSPWEQRQLGDAGIPHIDVPFIRCWGNSNANKSDALTLDIISNCSTDEYIYIAQNLYTGTIKIHYHYLDAKELTPARFYRQYQNKVRPPNSQSRGSKDTVTEYQCRDDIIAQNTAESSTNSMVKKAIFCTRSYINIRGLFDVLFVAASVDKSNKALVSKFSISGLDMSSATAFTKRFLKAGTWK